MKFYCKVVISVLLVLFLVQCSQKRPSNNEFVPQWAKDVVWYQIFPERFRNGDSLNDPKYADIQGAWPHDSVLPWQIHPWNSDWYALQDYEKANGNDIWYNITRRRYGGDLQGIIDKLDYLKALGIGAIYLNPIFTAPSHHKYDAACYHHVEPTFGPDPEGDKKLILNENPLDSKTWIWTKADLLALKLIKEVHKRGMKIIFDGVFNHVGINNFAFKDVVKNQKQSVFKDWFTIKSWNDSVKGTKFDYEGWFGVKDLPEIKEDNMGIVKGPKEYIFDCTERWMRPVVNGKKRDGIDGWRLDVAFCVNHKFWKDWRILVKSLNPEAYLTAEVIDSVMHIKPYLQGDEFDAVMNYNFAFACTDFFVNDKKAISAKQFDKNLEEIRNTYPIEVSYVLQNLFNSHDANRISSHIVNKDLGNFSDWGKYFAISKATNINYNTRKPSIADYQILKLMIVFQMTYIGAPMIYYGDEVGMWGANDPCCRKPMIWDDYTYDVEYYSSSGEKFLSGDEVVVNQSLLKFYKKIIAIRNSYSCLRSGNYRTILADNKNQVFCFERKNAKQKIIVIVNNSNQRKKIKIPEISGSEYKNLMDSKVYYKNSELLLLPKSAMILLKG